MEKIRDVKQIISGFIGEIPEFLRMQQSEDFMLIQNEGQIAEGQMRIINTIKEQILQYFAEGVFDIDYKTVLSRCQEV